MDWGSQLQCVDSIMEADVIPSLIMFMKTGGKPIDAIDMLAENYRGFPSMCNQIFTWLRLLGKISPDVATNCDALIMSHLQYLAEKHFDPKAADTIFSALKSSPKWLEYIMDHPGWRKLLYSLSEQYPDCLMLKFAIRTIKKNLSASCESVALSEFHNKIVEFPVFVDTFRDLLSQLMASPTKFTSLVSDLARNCTQTQHAYVFSQRILSLLQSSITDDKQVAFFHRLSQEISAYATKHYGTKVNVGLLDLALNGARQYPNLVSVLSSIFRGRMTSADVIKLDKIYFSKTPPPAIFLRTSKFFDSLIKYLLRLDVGREEVQVEKSLKLLAYAAAIKDAPSNLDKLPSIESSNDDKFGHVFTSLNAVYGMCSIKSFDNRPSHTFHNLCIHVKISIASVVVIEWIKLNLTNPNHYAITHQSQITSVMIAVLAEIVTIHPLQHEQIFEIIKTIFHLPIPCLDAIPLLNFRRNLIRFMVHLIHHGSLENVFHMLKENVPRMDHSLIRNFFVHLFGTILHPYSIEFINYVLDLFSLRPCQVALENAPKNRKRKHDKKDEISDLSENQCRKLVARFSEYVLSHEELLSQNQDKRTESKKILKKFVNS